MGQVVIQYTVIVVLVVGLGYLAYLLKDKGVNIKDDYFGLTYAILTTLEGSEFTTENIKNILRVISKTVKYVEINYKNDDNKLKEEVALKMSKEAMQSFNFISQLDDESIKYIIRIAASMLPSTHENQVDKGENGSEEKIE